MWKFSDDRIGVEVSTYYESLDNVFDAMKNIW